MRTQRVAVAYIGMWVVALACLYTYAFLPTFLLCVSGLYFGGKHYYSRHDWFYETSLGLVYMWSWLLFDQLSCHVSLLVGTFLFAFMDVLVEEWIHTDLERDTFADNIHVVKTIEDALVRIHNVVVQVGDVRNKLLLASHKYRTQEEEIQILKRHIAVLYNDIADKNAIIRDVSQIRTDIAITTPQAQSSVIHKLDISEQVHLSQLCTMLSNRCESLENELGLIYCKTSKDSSLLLNENPSVGIVENMI